jgi:hypothetical protein
MATRTGSLEGFSFKHDVVQTSNGRIKKTIKTLRIVPSNVVRKLFVSYRR